MKRKWFGTLVALALVLCIAGGATLAFLMVTTPSLTNVFQYGHVTCAVQEEFDGTTKSDVSIKNTGDTQSYIRVKLVFTWKDKDGNVSAQPVTDQDYKMDLNKVDWFEKDGYYYYTKALTPGEVTAPIFTAVTFKADMGNEYQNATATVDVSAQAVQTANNGATVMDAQGWPNA